MRSRAVKVFFFSFLLASLVVSSLLSCFGDKKEKTHVPAIRNDEPLALVNKRGMWGFIDRTGRVAIEFLYNDALPYSDGLALVKKGFKFGFIDKNGVMVIPAKYYDARSFHDGMARVQHIKKWGFIDRSGVFVIHPDDDAETRRGAARVKIGDWWGLWIKAAGLSEPRFNGADDFSEGFARVRVGKKYGFINRKWTYAVLHV